MATTSEKISALDTKITRIEEKMEKIEMLKEQEDGGSSNNFRTQFQDIDKLQILLEKYKAQRATLTMGLR